MIYQLDEEEIVIEVIYKNNKNVYMRFQKPNILVVTCHRWVSQKEIIKIIEKNKKALLKMLDSIKKEEKYDDFYWYLGRKYEPKFIDSIKKVEFNNDHIIAKDQTMLDRFTKKETERVFKSEIERILPYFNNIPFFDLKIRKMKTRWGVCNRGNNTITLNSELIKKDLDLLDYVIIHELCHFYEANHSSKFWDYVEKYYPKYKDARKRLRGSL